MQRRNLLRGRLPLGNNALTPPAQEGDSEAVFAVVRLRLTALLALGAIGSSVALASGSTVSIPLRPVAGLFQPDLGADDWLLAQRVGPGGTVPVGAFERAMGEALAVGRETTASDPALARAAWELVGPRAIGGRVTDIAVDPNEANVVYVASASGGVWKSTDAGLTFTPAWPRKRTQAIGALEIASDGTLYAGTGEANPGGGSIVYGGTGVYRSTDGAQTWKRVGLKRSGAIGRIEIDPTDAKRIFVAASGNLFKPGGQRGLYRSLDGGQSWQRVLPGANRTTGAVDVQIDRQDPTRVFVAMWDHLRVPDLRRYGGPGSGVFRSTDGGTTWKRLGGGLPKASPDVGRIGLAVAASDANRVYAIVIKTEGVFEGFYSSEDGGDSWTKIEGSQTVDLSQSTYGWWFGRVWVDPVNPLHVFVGGIALHESVDGGRNFTVPAPALSSANVHPDQHAMEWDPLVPGRVYLGNDGGLYRSDSNAGSEASWIVSTDMPWTQFYSVAVSEQDITRVSGGAQDNGSLRSWGVGHSLECAAWSNCVDWNIFFGGDGEKNLINPQNQDNVFACLQYGVCARSTDGGERMIGFATVGLRKGWFSPLEFDPSNPDIMYFGSDLLSRSTDNGQTFQVVDTPELTGGEGRDQNYPFGTLTTIAVGKTNGKTIFVGTDDGRVWYTHDLKRWTRARDRDLPQRWVTRVAVHPKNHKVAFATFSGFRSGVKTPHVSMTRDGGRTWRNISGNLPKAPVNDVVVKRRLIYVATDVGVFLTKTYGRKWLRVGKGLPASSVHDIHFHKATKSVVAATFGRGIWKVALPKGY